MKRKILVSAFVVFAMLSAAAIGFVWQSRSMDEAAKGTTIKDSYAYDVTDKAVLMDHADTAFVGTVVAKVETIEDEATTVWRVSVQDVVKASASGEVLVRQLGYVDSEGHNYATEAQPLLTVGKSYLLVTTVDKKNQHTLIAGPTASVAVKSATHLKELVAQYKQAGAR